MLTKIIRPPTRITRADTGSPPATILQILHNLVVRHIGVDHPLIPARRSPNSGEKEADKQDEDADREKIPGSSNHLRLQSERPHGLSKTMTRREELPQPINI